MELKTTVGCGPWAAGAQTCQRKGCSSTQDEPDSSSALGKMLDVGSCHKQRTSFSAEVSWLKRRGTEQQQHLPPLSLEFLSQQLPSPGIVDIDVLIYLLSIPFPSPQTHTTNTHSQLNENRELTRWFSAISPTSRKC